MGRDTRYVPLKGCYLHGNHVAISILVLIQSKREFLEIAYKINVPHKNVHMLAYNYYYFIAFWNAFQEERCLPYLIEFFPRKRFLTLHL